MSICARIVAEHAGDIDDPQNDRWKIVFVGVIESTNALRAQECFGYAAEVSENGQVEKWPFLLMPPKTDRSGMLDFGPNCDYEHEEVNIFERAIEVGSLFTRGDPADASTYRIVAITPQV
ncbi:MAG: hypothetical protein WBP11_14980 [Dokdonella sp.]